jgi:tetratricopeptide (TPR) repeat protein
MRFADAPIRAARAVAALALCAAYAGCASLSSPFTAWTQPEAAAPTPDAAASAPAPIVTMQPIAPATRAAAPASAATAATAAATTAATTAAPRPSPESGLSVAVVRDFDNARKALRAGRVDEAERGFRALTKDHPELAGPHANLGLIHRQANKLPEAVAELETAVTLSPEQPQYHNQLGITYRQQGQFKKAREAYERAIELDPDYAAATLNLGILHDLYLWDGKRALELYDRYLALSPGGDAVVTKWVADLKNRKTAPITVSRKEQP